MNKIYVVPENDTFWAKTKAWVRNRCTDAQCFYEEHPVICWIVIPAAAKGAFDLMKLGIKSRNLAKEEALKTLYCYDRRGGHYWELAKPLSNTDWLQVQDRMKNGEALGDILASLGVLRT